MSNLPDLTREAWLMRLAGRLEQLFVREGHSIPAYRVTCGWPDRGGTSRKHRIEGQCWMAAHSADEHFEIFINPLLDDAAQVAGVLAHEMVHAVLDNGDHKGPFRRLGRAIGLEGKPTEMGAGPKFRERIAWMLEELGPYPHHRLKLPEGEEKKQTTRLLKASCKQCGYTCRVTRKWLDEAGAPICPRDMIPLGTAGAEEDDD